MDHLCYLSPISARISNGQINGTLSKKYQGSIAEYLKAKQLSESSVGAFKGNGNGLDFSAVEIYRGIPYAEPPIGDSMFQKAPIYTHKFPANGYDCTKFGNWAIQDPTMLDGHKMIRSQMLDGLSNYEMSLDCLTLNVYKPQIQSSRIPVFVWIHGGGFNMGSAIEYDGEFLASSRQQIVVTVNYRLGFLGFLGGNYGLWDMRRALEWVRAEIHNFGGDPENVHLAGESAGGVAVSLQLNHDIVQSKEFGQPQLFKKVTLMSGVANCPWGCYTKWQEAISHELCHDFLVAKGNGYQAKTADIESIQEYFKTCDQNTLKKLMQEATMFCFGKMMSSFNIARVCSINQPCMDDEFHFPESKQFDFAGYDVTYGLLNADGFIFATSAVAPDTPDIAHSLLYDETLGRIFFETMNRQKNPQKMAVQLYRDGLSRENILRFIKQNFNIGIEDWITQKCMLKESIYKSYTYPYTENVDQNFQTMAVVATDINFILPSLLNLLNVRKNGGKVKAYLMEHGFSNGPKFSRWYENRMPFDFFGIAPGDCMAKELWENGYNCHADDLYFLFGENMAGTATDSACVDPDSPPRDMEMSVQLAKVIFGGMVECDSSYEEHSISVVAFGPDGLPKNKENYKRQVLEMYNTLIPGIMKAAKKTVKVSI